MCSSVPGVRFVFFILFPEVHNSTCRVQLHGHQFKKKQRQQNKLKKKSQPLLLRCEWNAYFFRSQPGLEPSKKRKQTFKRAYKVSAGGKVMWQWDGGEITHLLLSHRGSGQHQGPRLKCPPYRRRRRSNILLPLSPITISSWNPSPSPSQN